mmetsp:Transcript_23033/g.63047  ORF Transcript_23033/g.63047 Transcript_23033/m.63047 type:complete len:274 (-) Transcript_23033:567-1388(-)
MELDPIVMASVALVILTVIFFAINGAPAKKKKPSSSAKFLSKSRQSLTLGERTNISHDTVRFRFILPEEKPVLGLPVGKHFKLFAPNRKGKVEGEWNGRPDKEVDEPEIERKYTPTTSDDEVGYVDLIIKVYKGGGEKFVDGGKMSQYLDSLRVGDKMDISGPWGMHEYLGKGNFKSGTKTLQASKVGMMAGGTGITPMLQVVAAILKDDTDTTTVSLLYANQTEGDILVRDILENLAERYPKRFKVGSFLGRRSPHRQLSAKPSPSSHATNF